MGDLGKNIEISYLSREIDSWFFGVNLKPTQRILLNAINLQLISDAESRITIYYKRSIIEKEYWNISIDLPPMSGELTKIKLPPGLSVISFKIEITSKPCLDFRLDYMSFIYDIINVGFGGRAKYTISYGGVMSLLKNLLRINSPDDGGIDLAPRPVIDGYGKETPLQLSEGKVRIKGDGLVVDILDSNGGTILYVDTQSKEIVAGLGAKFVGDGSGLTNISVIDAGEY